MSVWATAHERATEEPLSPPVFVTVLASDPITRAGLQAELNGFARIVVQVGEPAEVPCRSDEVTVVATDPVTHDVVSFVRTNSSLGGRPVVVTERLDDDILAALVESGVRGIVRRSEASPERLAAVILAAANGEAAVPHDLLARLLQRSPVAPGSELESTQLSRLVSERESTILRLAAEGFDTPEIAAQLYYSERTVKSVIHDFVARHQLRNRTHAVAYAIRHGWL